MMKLNIKSSLAKDKKQTNHQQKKQHLGASQSGDFGVHLFAVYLTC